MADGTQNKTDDDLEFRNDRDKSVSGSGEPFSRTNQDLPPGESPAGRGPGASSEATEDEETEGQDGDYTYSNEDLGNTGWLIQKAQEMYTISTDYLDANITNFWERNLAHFHSEHAPGTAYRRKGFKRSRTFRPKTRANVKQQEAGLANALFSTMSLVSVTPQNPLDPQQAMSAAVNGEMLQYRLEYRMPWFMTAQGAYQNTKVYGLCISHQSWSYREDTDVVPAFDESGAIITEVGEDGVPQAMGYAQTVVREDNLRCDLVEPENFRFDPMCDWRDPATTSPYLVYMMPIYANEALELMETIDGKTGKSRWIKHSLAEILATRRQDYDRTRQAREGRERIDPADENRGNEFTTLWAHMNILKINGEDYVFWTMGTELVLTMPEKLMDVEPWLRPGERPFTVGYSTVEAHRNYPAGDVEQSVPMQEEINMVANQRLDNVKLVLNKRYFVRRGSQVDLDALIRNVPGGGVMMNDPEKDVTTQSTPDVTGSSYNEQALLAQEMDALIGGFDAQASQQSSVGGQQMAGAAANAVQDYGIKIFVETWVEPTLRQLQRLVAMYETDDALVTLAGEKSGAFQRFGQDALTDQVLLQNLSVRVDAGMGNTDPMRRVERLVFGVGKAAELPGMAPRIKGMEVSDEIFGALGYRDASRFLMTDDEWSAYQEENPPGPGDIDVKMRELDIRADDNKMRDDRERLRMESDHENKVEDRLAKQDMKLDELMQRLSQAQLSDQTTREKADRDDKTKRDTAAAALRQKTKEANQAAVKPEEGK
jgi:hypothetical protein